MREQQADNMSDPAAALHIAPLVGAAADRSLYQHQKQGTRGHPPQASDLSAADEQRRAQRRHRKRIARIVADQWLWFTRERLAWRRATQHHVRTLLGSGLQAFQRHAAQQALLWRQAVIWHKQRGFLMLGDCLHQWLLCAQRGRQRDQRALAVLKIRQLALVRQIMAAWKAQTAAKRAQRQAALRASYFNSFVLLTNAMAAWRTRTAELHIKSRQRHTALTHWAHAWRLQTLRAWAAAVRQQEALRAMKATADAHFRGITLAASLAGWREHAQQMGVAREAAFGLLQGFAQRQQTAQASHMLLEWRVAVQQAKEWRSVKDTVAADHRQGVLVKAFSRWQGLQQTRRERKAQAARHHAAGVRHWVLRGWFAAIHMLQDEEQKEAWAFDQYATTLLDKALLGWQQAIHRRRQKAALRKAAQKRLLLRCVRGWTQVTEAKQEAELLRRRGVRFHYLRTLRCAVTAWRAYCQLRADKAALRRTAVGVYHRSLAMSGLAVWLREFMPLARQQRAAAMRAALFWKRMLLQRVVRNWCQAAQILAEKRARVYQAQAHAQQHVQQWAWAAWRQGCLDQADRRAAKQERLQQMRAVLHRAKLRRVFRGWAEMHSDALMKRFQVARARCLHNTRLQQLALRAWTAYRAQRRRHKANLGAAAELRQRALLAKAFDGWAQAVAAGKAKRSRDCHAVRHWSAVQQGKAMQAWVAYVAARRAKHARLALGLRLHRSRLQREGISQWLAVGSALHQQRLHQLAVQQVVQMSAELSRVLPYARHWRKVALARRAARLHTPTASRPRAKPAHRPSTGIPDVWQRPLPATAWPTGATRAGLTTDES
ncbi:hypothetical protein WJX72_008821 [[Myrmecia] bisecta]|uniref:Sfi1 spindle body domain-containing protein n=1 Tax=[Myrmecia] bisecta TaxID=41462 RepID=A0AAW1P7R2_9CHLO